MNDFDYDVLQKKRIARGAYHRKGTHGRKGITLRQDHMTTSQLKKENGPIMEYRLNEPMLWSEFRAMPEDLQQTYLNLLREKFNASNHDLAAMFGIGLKRFNMLYPAGGYHRQNDDQKAAWARFLGDIKAVNEPQNDEVEDDDGVIDCSDYHRAAEAFEEQCRKRAIKDQFYALFHEQEKAEQRTIHINLAGQPHQLSTSLTQLLYTLDTEREYDVSIKIDAIYG